MSVARHKLMVWDHGTMIGRQAGMLHHTLPLTDGTVVLDRFTLHDIEAHLAGEDEEQARRFGWHPAHSTAETVRAAILRWEEGWECEGPRRAFAVRVDGTLVGGCEIRLSETGEAHLSYWTFPLYRGRGIAARAIRLACRYAFEHLEVERMEALIEPDNLASRRAAQRAGFAEEGLLRGTMRCGAQRRDVMLTACLAGDGEPG